MRRGLSAWLVLAFLLVALLLLAVFNNGKPRVLVLHSGQRDALTVQKIDEGLREGLSRNRQPLSLRFHYLGIDRLPDEDHREDAAKMGLRTIEQFDPDLVIAVDDEAQQYVMRRYGGRSRPKLVYAAIDQQPRAYGYVGLANVTGAMETLPLDAIRDTLLQVRQGQPTRLAVIGGPGSTSQGQMAQVQAHDWAPHVLVNVQAPADWVTWQTAIRALDGKADAVLVLSYEGLQANAGLATHVPPEQVAVWTEAHAVPLPISVDVSYTQLGGGLSLGPSARMMGELAAEQALLWLKAAPGDGPPSRQATQMVPENHYSVALRASALQARHLSLPSVYTEAARLGHLYYP